MTVPSPSTTVDPAATAERILREVVDDDLGAVSASVYETGRLVSVAPWLDGHARRLWFLSDSQIADGEAAGSWGEPGYRLVPTLSATEALLTVLSRPELPTSAPSRPELVKAVHHALEHLASRLAGRAAETVVLPDTVAIELIVPAIVTRINEHLSDPGQLLGSTLPDWCDTLKLGLPPGCQPELLAKLRRAPAHAVPDKLWYSWEIIAPVGARTPHVRLVGGGLGCSPAATATWLGELKDVGHPSVSYLHRVQRRHGGPVPGTAPIETFEAAWVLAVLAGHRVPHTPPPALLGRLRATLTEHGAATGLGLPRDPDTTGEVLHVLALHGHDASPDALIRFFTDDHFYTFRNERNPSISSNAHALETLAGHVGRHPEHEARYGSVIEQVTDWLLAHQHEDGYWTDKWHASAYYATACCSQALAASSDGPASRQISAALARASSWTVTTQQRNGRWGRGLGTLEETAYAVRILNRHQVPGARQALDAARTALHEGDPIGEEPPHLWYDKDLYAPYRVVQATILAALHTLTSP